MGVISSDTKQAFGRMLVFLKTAQTADNTLYPFIAYADTLIVWTEAGLKTTGRYKVHEVELNKANVIFKAAVSKMATQDYSHLGWQKAEIINASFEINRIVFPIAMMEGLLILNQDMINVSAMMLGAPDAGGQVG
jgi:hypothetical protein